MREMESQYAKSSDQHSTENSLLLESVINLMPGFPSGIWGTDLGHQFLGFSVSGELLKIVLALSTCFIFSHSANVF